MKRESKLSRPSRRLSNLNEKGVSGWRTSREEVAKALLFPIYENGNSYSQACNWEYIMLWCVVFLYRVKKNKIHECLSRFKF